MVQERIRKPVILNAIARTLTPVTNQAGHASGDAKQITGMAGMNSSRGNQLLFLKRKLPELSNEVIKDIGYGLEEVDI